MQHKEKKGELEVREMKGKRKKRDKHNPPGLKVLLGKPESNFIKFSDVQKNYLKEIRNRQLKELNEAITLVYGELGIREKMAQANPGTYRLRQDFSGLDVLPTMPKDNKNK